VLRTQEKGIEQQIHIFPDEFFDRPGRPEAQDPLLQIVELQNAKIETMQNEMSRLKSRVVKLEMMLTKLVDKNPQRDVLFDVDEMEDERRHSQDRNAVSVLERICEGLDEREEIKMEDAKEDPQVIFTSSIREIGTDVPSTGLLLPGAELWDLGLDELRMEQELSLSDSPSRLNSSPFKSIAPEDFELSATDHVNKRLLSSFKTLIDTTGFGGARNDSDGDGDGDGDWED